MIMTNIMIHFHFIKALMNKLLATNRTRVRNFMMECERWEMFIQVSVVL